MNALLFATVVGVSQSFLPLSVEQLAHATKQVQRETDLLIVESMKELYRIGRLVPVAPMDGRSWVKYADTSHTHSETVTTARTMLQYIGGTPDKPDRFSEMALMAKEAERLKGQNEKLEKEFDALIAEYQTLQGVPGKELVQAGLRILIVKKLEALGGVVVRPFGTNRPMPSTASGWLAGTFTAIYAHSEMCAARNDIKRAVERLAKEPSAK